jgi:hypothetical protein
VAGWINGNTGYLIVGIRGFIWTIHLLFYIPFSYRREMNLCFLSSSSSSSKNQQQWIVDDF